MKKELVLTYVVIIFSLLVVTIHDYYSYSTVTNEFVSKVINEVSNKENVNEEDIIKIINSDSKSKDDVLKKYGFSDNDINVINRMNLVYKRNLIGSVIIGGGVILVITLVVGLSNRRRKKEIENIIDYLRKLNNGVYDLDIACNEEGLMSILKNEIYTTMIILREKALKESEDKKNLKDTLADISHQLKTPLTSIMIMLDSLMDEEMDIKTRHEFLNDIKEQIENINFLILSMLKLSRLDANVIKFNKELINVQKLLLEVLKNLDILRELKDVNIHIKGKSDVSFVGDYKWMLEAITNIIKNAIEYTPSGKNIYVLFEENNIYTKIEVIDEGNGFKKEELTHVFERFYKGKYSGSNNFGIGLSLAKEIISKNNGSIKVSNNDNGGAKFVIKFYH